MPSFSNWRDDLREVVDSDTPEQNVKEIKDKKGIKNKVIINPTIPESLQEIGGELIDIREIDESTAAIALSPQELAIQKKKSQLDIRLAKKRQQSMNRIKKDAVDIEKQDELHQQQDKQMAALNKEEIQLAEVKVSRISPSDSKEDKKKKIQQMLDRQREWEKKQGKVPAGHATEEVVHEGKCDDCECPGCGPDGVGHQNPCIECGGHHKEEKEFRSIDESGWHRRNPEKVGTPEDPDYDVLRRRGKPVKASKPATTGPASKKPPGIYKPNKEGKFVKVDEAKVDTGKSDTEKAEARNKRNTPPGKDKDTDLKTFITRKTGESLQSARARVRRQKHQKQQAAAKAAKSKERASGMLKKYDADGDGKVRVIDAGYNPEGEVIDETVSPGVSRQLRNVGRKQRSRFAKGAGRVHTGGSQALDPQHTARSTRFVDTSRDAHTGVDSVTGEYKSAEQRKREHKANVARRKASGASMRGENFSNWKNELIEKDLSAKERRALPNKDFALPGKGEGPQGKQAGSYPIPDEKHARSALSLVSQHGTPEEKAKVRAKVKKKFPGIQVNEADDKAFKNVVGMLQQKYGKDSVITKDSPKPKPQPKAKPKPQKPLTAQEKAQREVDARYGRTPWNKKGSLGT